MGQGRALEAGGGARGARARRELGAWLLRGPAWGRDAAAAASPAGAAPRGLSRRPSREPSGRRARPRRGRMGCGGSRADAIEPRYYESWTRETESTWLTYTDSDAPPSNTTPDSGPEAVGLHAGERARPLRTPRRREAGARGGRRGGARGSAVLRGISGVGREGGKQTDRSRLVLTD